jgi:RNA polymerase-interacting CarD/CdnL/TRCF family regulator
MYRLSPGKRGLGSFYFPHPGGLIMLLYDNVLEPGDPIFHPKFGFGTVHGLKRCDRVHPVHEPAVAEADTDRTEDYYDINLVEGGTLLVPVRRAVNVGLRRLTEGVEEVRASLRSQAESLPAEFRQRAAALRIREQLPEPGALARSVRDMLAQSRGRTLSLGEKTWLDKSCQRLITEASLVDHISMFQARAAIQVLVRELSVGP